MSESDKQLQDCIPALLERTKQFLSSLGLDWKINVDTSKSVDPGIEFDATGIGIMVFWGEHPSIIGPKPEIQYGAYTTSYNPGDRETPPSWDTEELGEASANMDLPLILAIQTVVGQHLDNIVDAEADQAFDAAMAEVEAAGGEW